MEPQFAGQCNLSSGNPRGTAGTRDPPGWSRTPRIRIALALAMFGLAPAMACASQQGVDAMKRWKAMDACAIEAQAAFPDFTPEATAKRDAKLKECLAAQNLPPREPQSRSR